MEQMNSNPFLQGLRAGTDMGKGISNMISGSPIENAMKKLQAGGDAGQIYQELLTQDPASAQQFFQMIQMQQQGGQNQQPMGQQPIGVMPLPRGAF